MMRNAVIIAVLAGLALPAAAEVRFGKNVRIGGHDVSNQTFPKQKRGRFIIHNTTPKNEGCVLRRNGDGSTTKVCNLKRKKTKESR
jgi:hypothetical protein